MAISKVTLNGTTQMDVTHDTVVANHLLEGDMATGSDGEPVLGTLEVDVVVDPTLSNTGEAADAKVTGDYISDIKNTSTDRLFVSDFSEQTSVAMSVNQGTGEITITNNSNATYKGVWTSTTWGSRLVVGQKYRLHCKAQAVTGSPEMHVAVQGTADGENRVVARIDLTSKNEAYIDFVATEYIKRVTIYVAYTNATQGSVAKFWDLWIRAVDTDMLPSHPTANGTYTLRCVVSGGLPTYSWVST